MVDSAVGVLANPLLSWKVCFLVVEVPRLSWGPVGAPPGGRSSFLVSVALARLAGLPGVACETLWVSVVPFLSCLSRPVLPWWLFLLLATESRPPPRVLVLVLGSDCTF